MTVSPSVGVRSELVDYVHRDLLGPWGGEQETIEGTPRNRYLIGALAPRAVDDRDQGQGNSHETQEAAEPADLRHSDDGLTTNGDPETRTGVPVPEDEEVSSAEGAGEEQDSGPIGSLTHPSSMGLRCHVPADATELRVTARWGQYIGHRETTPEGRDYTAYTRTPFEAPCTVNLDKPSVDPRTLNDAGDIRVHVEVFHDGDRRVVEVALVNAQVTGYNAPPQYWLFQSELIVTATDGSAVFLPAQDPLIDAKPEPDRERRQLRLLYRNRLEFAIGRTCSVTWTEDPQRRRATDVRTTWLPTAQIPQTRAVGAEGVMLDMNELADATADQLTTGLAPLIQGYEAWLATQDAEATDLPEHLAQTARETLEDAGHSLDRLRHGLRLLTENEQALQAFHFANRAMRDQRIHSEIVALRAADPDLDAESAAARVASRGARVTSWYPFQLAFVVMQLAALTDPTVPWRSGAAARAELLFFPTGGGKTEAYLGLAAYTFAIRRLQGVVESADGPLDGGDGVAVLMRYTLRLLTAQQFQRATTLVCAAEMIRMSDQATWGSKPFRIGLWVGTSVSPKRFKEAKDQLRDARDSQSAYGLTVLQVKRCPWCGEEIKPLEHVDAVQATQRIHVYCGAGLPGSCPFSRGGSARDGLPMLTVDEEIYRHPPTFLLATVDKFARLAREGEAASLLGYVREECERHGYRHTDTRPGVCSASNHPAKTEQGRDYPKASVRAVSRLRPPDLIVQDELHLITGALGTSVGLFEAVIDTLSKWVQPDGDPVLPLVVASTATVRNATEQVRALYGRGVEIFPPRVLDVADTYFSEEIPVDEENPGRQYLGISAHGARLTLAEIRVSEILLLAGQQLLDHHGDAADPYLTLVSYFSATRELAGMRRFLDDDVTIRVSNPDKSSGFPRRTSRSLEIGELTSRISSADIAAALARLAVPFDSDQHSTPARAKIAAELAAAEKEKRKPRLPERGEQPYDVLLATSMLQVGVDVSRLGLMLVVGQPKNTAEYIQASSRVGRSADRPGLVIALANWSRPRDSSHFEQFRHYHETFYAQVEALSVTPYSDASLDRGLMGVLVSAARVRAATDAGSLSGEQLAGRVVDERAHVDALIDELAARAGRASRDDTKAQLVRNKLVRRLDAWYEKAQLAHAALAYERTASKVQTLQPLLVSPESTTAGADGALFRVANSMREVQPEINLLVSPSREKLAPPEPTSAPRWTFPADQDGAS